MEKIIEAIKGFDFENFDFMAIINSLVEIVKSLLSGFIGGKEEA